MRVGAVKYLIGLATYCEVHACLGSELVVMHAFVFMHSAGEWGLRKVKADRPVGWCLSTPGDKGCEHGDSGPCLACMCGAAVTLVHDTVKASRVCAAHVSSHRTPAWELQ